MSDLFFARAQMAVSLGFHIIFAVAGIGMPVLMVAAEWRWLRTGDPVWKLLARRWATGTAILFAVGAVSGTVLAFELGLLWPGFMSWAGAVIGLPFALEGFAFFAEAIFLGIYLYGWERVHPRAHLAAGVIVALGGAASAAFVVSANAWMNVPTGFRVDGGRIADVDLSAVLFSPTAVAQAVHMLLAAYCAMGFAVAGVHAFHLLRDAANLFHRRALGLGLGLGAITAVLQPVSGDLLARQVARSQPVKLAAMEGQFETRAGAPLRIGGFPDVGARETRYALEIPGALSWLAHGDTGAVVQGLDSVPRELWPPVAAVHISFQVMVAAGVALLAVSLWAVVLWLRRRPLAASPSFLRAVVVSTPLGFIAIEAGWLVTELGRQPWVIQGVMRTSEAVTPMRGLAVPFIAFTAIYIFLAAAVTWLLSRQFRASPRGALVADPQPPQEEL